MTRYRQNPEIAWRRIDGDVLLVDPGRSQMRQLNAVGALVWETLDAPRTLDELVDAVVARFETSAAQARTDVQAFLEKLQQRELVLREESP